MNRSVSSTFLSFLLLFSISFAVLPLAGHAQVGSQTAALSIDYAKQLQAIEDKAVERQKELGIPGMSLVIVKDGQVIYAKGLGYKDFEHKIPVTPDTQFAIGSATKAFTALTVLMSQDEGKLSLDDSPKKVLPYFKMYDPDTDKNITIRDLMCHASGLNRTDLAMITGKLNRAELIQVAGETKPTAKLREKFQYQNIMFVAAGEIASTVQKMPYDKLVTKRIFDPLGMTNSTMSMKEMQKAKDYSYGYSYNFDTKETEKLPFRDIDEIAPAGSINSSANDMAQWLKFVLNGGTVAGRRLVSEKGYDEWLKPQMKIAGKTSYGFGWLLHDWNGLKVVEHGGNIDGFNSLVAMIPEKKLGFVLLTNVSASSIGNDLMPVVWQNLIDDAKSEGDVKPPDGAGPIKADSAAAKELIGKYSIPGGNGAVDIKESDGKVTFNITGQPPYALGDRTKDTYTLAPLPANYWLKVKRDAAGKLTSVAVVQPEGEFEFKRAGASENAEILPPVDELMQKTVTAAGGEQNWRKIKSRVTTFDLDLENQGVRGYGTSYSKAPNMSATATTLTALGKKIATGFDYFDGVNGEEAYTFAPAQKYTGKRLEDVRLAADFYSLLDWKTNFKKVEVTGRRKVGDEDAYVVAFTPVSGTPFTEYYSTTSFLQLRHDGIELSSTSSQQIPFTIVYSDYRKVDGIMLPFKTVNSSISNGNIVTMLRSVKHNVPIAAQTFTPRKLK